MHKGSGLLWALERRGAAQIARILLLAGIDATTRTASSSTPRGARPRRGSLRRRRPSPTLRLVLP
jgi:hypothetical protein